MKKRIFSGIQPSGNLTIGNYLGALKQWVVDQEQHDSIFCVVDMHAITVPQDPTQLREKTREIAALYIASGINPDNVIMFVQSHVTAHVELGWILTCLTPLGWLNRMTQFKDKSSKQQQDSVGTGLLTYPALMAADILLYKTHYVPVGDDQKQHLEFTRDIAQRFNSTYGETFILPEITLPKAGARVMGLDNPLAKMSKSDPSEYHAVYILDTPEVLKKKIMRSVTDSYGEICFSKDEDRAGVNNLLTIYQALTGESQLVVEAHFAGKGYGDLKRSVLEQVSLSLQPIQERYHHLMKDKTYLDATLRQGAERASVIANETLRLVRERVGLVNLA